MTPPQKHFSFHQQGFPSHSTWNQTQKKRCNRCARKFNHCATGATEAAEGNSELCSFTDEHIHSLAILLWWIQVGVRGPGTGARNFSPFNEFYLSNVAPLVCKNNEPKFRPTLQIVFASHLFLEPPTVRQTLCGRDRDRPLLLWSWILQRSCRDCLQSDTSSNLAWVTLDISLSFFLPRRYGAIIYQAQQGRLWTQREGSLWKPLRSAGLLQKTRSWKSRLFANFSLTVFCAHRDELPLSNREVILQS